MNPQNDISIYKYLNFLGIFYAFTQIATVVLAYRLIKLGPFIEPGGILIFPLGYVISDVIAEIYGYKISKQIVWATFFVVMAFSITATIIIHLPAPKNWQQNTAYMEVFGNGVRSAFSQVVGVTIGGLINIYAISKWKILMQGRYFWLRSLGANAIGEVVTTVLIASILFFGKMPILNLTNIIFNMYFLKMFYVLLMVIPASICVKLLKIYENKNVNNVLNFNPFKANRA